MGEKRKKLFFNLTKLTLKKVKNNEFIFLNRTHRIAYFSYSSRCNVKILI